MNELRLAKRDRAKKNQDEGRVPLPLKRKAERERIEQKTRGGEYVETIRTRLEDLPPLARKYVIENEGGMMLTAAEDRPVTPAEMRNLEGQLSDMERERLADRRRLTAERDQRIAGEVDAKATSLMNSEGIDYSAAVRRVVADGEHFASPEEPAQGGESLAGAVERRMRQDSANYLTEDDEAAPVGSVHGMEQGEYQSRMREAMQRRGYGNA